MGDVDFPEPGSERGMEAVEITVTYPDGSHTFRRTGPDAWDLDLVTPEGAGPSVMGYDNGNVLRVVAAFLVRTAG